jgi:starch synthase (maltosyl-transferring)
VPTYGIYTGYELMECVARPGVEEQIDNEKYEYKNRHWEDYEPGGPKEGQSLAPYLTRCSTRSGKRPSQRCAGCAISRFHRIDDPTTP